MAAPVVREKSNEAGRRPMANDESGCFCFACRDFVAKFVIKLIFSVNLQSSFLCVNPTSSRAVTLAPNPRHKEEQAKRIENQNPERQADTAILRRGERITSRSSANDR